MNVFEIGQYYGVGCFRADLLYVSERIKDILERNRNRAEDYVNELFILAPFPWNGQRKIGVINYCEPKIMDRLEALQKEYPDVALFSGVFPRLKGQACRQILWYLARRMPRGEIAVLIGLEADLVDNGVVFLKHVTEWENPPHNTPPQGQWCGPQVPY